MKTSRFVGIDIHRQQVVIAAVDQHQNVLLSPQKISNQQFGKWANKHLKPSDQVAIEATTNSWTFHDQLEPLVKCVLLAHSYKLKLITASSCKTDSTMRSSWQNYWLPTCYPPSGYLLSRFVISVISPTIAGN